MNTADTVAQTLLVLSILFALVAVVAHLCGARWTRKRLRR